MARPALIAVAGLMGSGKTTLARALAGRLRWRYLPESLPALDYLNDLFRNRKRWSFDAQVAFLAYKSLQILRARQDGIAVVLDRSLYEDSEIFARHFFDKGEMDARSYGTYVALAAHFIDSVGPPDITIECRCKIATAESRISSRGRDYQARYPKGHLQEISARYDQWRSHYTHGPLVTVDGDRVDWRDSVIQARIVEELETLLTRTPELQLRLFPASSPPARRTSGRVSLLRTLRPPTRPTTFAASLHTRNDAARSGRPIAYVAAPFTARTAPAPSPRQRQLFAADHGIIPRGPYRTALLRMCEAMESLGLQAFLPHRDVNRWGRRSLSADRVVQECTAGVHSCDIFVGLLGASHGSHYEFGLALGLGKPCIALRCDELPSSFVAGGMTALNSSMLTLHCKRLGELRKVLVSREVIDFLARFVPLGSQG